MTCSECQLRIFERDLDSDATAHLADCEECRALDREVGLNAEALTSMRDDLVPVRPKRRWPWAVAGMAAAAMLAVTAISEPPPPAPVTLEAPPPVELAATPQESAPVVRPVRRAPRKPADTAQLVQILTDDPDIVIYWLLDSDEGDNTL
jgi:hypothetical protein